jgi:hypothetical protein
VCVYVCEYAGSLNRSPFFFYTHLPPPPPPPPLQHTGVQRSRSRTTSESLKQSLMCVCVRARARMRMHEQTFLFFLHRQRPVNQAEPLLWCYVRAFSLILVVMLLCAGRFSHNKLCRHSVITNNGYEYDACAHNMQCP